MIILDIEFNLTDTQIDKAIAKVQAYANSLDKKNQAFLDALVTSGELLAQEITSSSLDADYSDASVDSEVEHEYCYSEGYINLDGEDSSFIEFGAGMTYAVPQNPLASDVGMGVGTYPLQTHAFEPEGWYWKDENGNKHHSFGHPASAPLYSAEQEMEIKAPIIARQIFKG